MGEINVDMGAVAQRHKKLEEKEKSKLDRDRTCQAAQRIENLIKTTNPHCRLNQKGSSSKYGAGGITLEVAGEEENLHFRIELKDAGGLIMTDSTGEILAHTGWDNPPFFQTFLDYLFNYFAPIR